MMTCAILGGCSWWNLPKSNKIVCIMHLVWIQQYNHAIFNTVGTAVVWTVGPGLRLLLRAVAQLPGLPGCLRGAGKWSNISNSLSFASITAIHLWHTIKRDRGITKHKRHTMQEKAGGCEEREKPSVKSNKAWKWSLVTVWGNTITENCHGSTS